MDEGAPTFNPNIAELAKSGRSTCKRCKALIASQTLRIGKAYDNGERVMTSWYHPHCWPVPKKLADVSEIAGWADLSVEHRADLISRAPNRAPSEGTASSAPPAHEAPAAAVASEAAASIHPVWMAAKASPAKVSTTGAARFNDGGGTFRSFTELCDRIGAVGSSLEKTGIISRHLDKLEAQGVEVTPTVRLLLPGKAHNHQTYQLKDKSLLAHLSTALNCSEVAMATHLEQSAGGDIGLTAEHFFEGSARAPSMDMLSLSDVLTWLERLASSEAAPLELIRALLPKCSPPELRYAMRLVRKDIRINAGSAVVLRGVGGDKAYDEFKSQPHELDAICHRARTSGGRGLGAAFQGGGGGVGGGGSAADSNGGAKGSGSICVGIPFKPQLAGQCSSFEKPLKAYPNGFFVEVKYDGERCQVHMSGGGSVQFFSRSLKEVGAISPHKVTGLTAAITAAFPSASSLILDGEVVMKAKDGTVLAFGAQGVHEQKKHMGAFPCLVIFDLLWLDGRDLTQSPLQARRAALAAALVPSPAVEISVCRLMRNADDLRVAFAEANAANLEGLMIKDVGGKYVPADRKLWMKMKRDYLGEGEASTAGTERQSNPRNLDQPSVCYACILTTIR